MHIHAQKMTHIHANTYTYIQIWIEICACMWYVWPFFYVEYIHHTCTYMQHTGMWNLIYTAYRISCICIYDIVSDLYLFNTYVSACIYSCICMYVIVFACICMYEQEYHDLPGDTLEGRHRDCLWDCKAVRLRVGLCSTHFQFTWSKDFIFFKAPPPPTRGSQWARSWPTCWFRIIVS
jgi:hypothetical protein